MSEDEKVKRANDLLHDFLLFVTDFLAHCGMLDEEIRSVKEKEEKKEE